MLEITTVGLDLAKNVFQAHGADASGRVVLAPEAATRSGAGVLQPAAALPGRDGSLRRCSFLGSRAGPFGPRRAAHPARLRQALRQAPEE